MTRPGAWFRGRPADRQVNLHGVVPCVNAVRAIVARSGLGGFVLQRLDLFHRVDDVRIMESVP